VMVTGACGKLRQKVSTNAGECPIFCV